jgi:catechol 2,3-dioxygenase-like lactoylglutathione lyase family enzyme
MGLGDYAVGATMATADLDKAKEFYGEKLGLEVEKDNSADGGPIIYKAGKGTGVAVYESPDHAGKSTATMAGWDVDDVDKVVDELIANGVTFEQYDEEGMKTDDRGVIDFDGFKVAFFRDPDGNTHSLNG